VASLRAAAARRAAATETPPAEPPTPAPPQLPSNDHEPVRASLDRLRDYARTPLPRKPASLRHTGLMRPVSRIEPALVPANTDNSVQLRADSAKRVRAEGPDPDEDGGDGLERFSDSDGQRDEGY
jgi:hypothetical protein